MSEIPEDKKPPVPIKYSRRRQLRCHNCDRNVTHKCTPWIVKSIKGTNNIYRRCVCTHCHTWHEEYGCAAIIHSRVPIKSKYDKIAHSISLKDLTNQFEKITEWKRKEEFKELLNN